MKDGVLLSYIALDLVFVGTGVLLLVFALITKGELSNPPDTDSVARNLILKTCPLNATIVNASFVFLTFILTLPAIIAPRSRAWLKISGYLAVFNALFTMIIGLTLWYETLKTRRNLSDIWDNQPPSSQSLLQTKFNCCGYLNSTTPAFVPDPVCPTALVAAARLGCVSPFASFANQFLDVIFTAAFGIVGVDVLFVLSTAIVLKDRKEQERYRHIDEKNYERGF